MDNLQDKAISIEGKEYVLVKDRIVYFNDTFPKGSITTELVSEPASKLVIIKATVKPDDTRVFTGYSQAVIGQGFINETSALENAETSAVGRALAMMGIGIIESLASADEMVKAGVTNKPTQLRSEEEVAFDTFMGNPMETLNELPFESKPKFVEKVENSKCPDCPNGMIVKNPKTGKLFCEKKCWLNAK